MSTLQISLNLSELPDRLVKVDPDGTALESGYTKIGTFEHAGDPGTDPLGATVNHVIYHHVRDALYKVKDGAVPDVGFWPDNITDMASVQIAYTAPVAVASLDVAPTTISIAEAATQQITPTVLPADATDKTVTYVSADVAVATVSGTGLVTGVAAGSTTVTVTTTDGGFEKEIPVTITAP